MSDITRDYSFGGWLRTFRLKRKIGLREASKALEMDAGNYSKLERSELSPPRSRKTINKIVVAFCFDKFEQEMLLSTAFSFHVGQLRKDFE